MLYDFHARPNCLKPISLELHYGVMRSARVGPAAKLRANRTCAMPKGSVLKIINIMCLKRGSTSGRNKSSSTSPYCSCGCCVVEIATLAAFLYGVVADRNSMQKSLSWCDLRRSVLPWPWRSQCPTSFDQRLGLMTEACTAGLSIAQVCNMCLVEFQASPSEQSPDRQPPTRNL